MEIIKFTIARNLFNLNISTRELKKLETLNAVSISNLTLRRLRKTMDTSNNANKKARIKQILNKKNYATYNPTNTGDHSQKQIIKPQSVNPSPNNQQDKAEHSQIELRQSKRVPVNAKSREEAVKNLNMLGVNIASLPKSYGELLIAIKKHLPVSVSKKLEAKFKKFKHEKLLTPKVTQRILRNLLKSPDCLKKLAEKFGGEYTTVWTQDENVLSKVRIGQEGLCGSLSLKWCGDKNQRINFFTDTASPEGLNEIISIKLSKDSKEVEMYCQARALRLSASSKHEINVQRNTFNIIDLCPEKGVGHAVAAKCQKEAEEYLFFDANSGEFSFSSAERMEQFINTYLSICYPDFVNIKTLHFNRLFQS